MTSPCDAKSAESVGSAASPDNSGRPLRVLLADDHLLVRRGIRQQLEEIPNLEVVGEAADGFEAVALCKTRSPDLVFMDICIPALNALQATRLMTAESPRVRVIILSSHDGKNYYRPAIAAGADAYLLKGESTQHLATAIQQFFGNRWS
jgi:DNA-binding NarL/FixJ family response regulator